MTVQEIVAFAMENRCSDVHLTEGEAPVFRQNGSLVSFRQEPVTGEEILALAAKQGAAGPEGGQDSDFAADMAGGRQRVNLYRQRGRLAAAIRLLNDKIPTMEELRLPPVLKTLCAEPRGLILVTGPTGSGKSTTLASMVDYIGKQKPCHVITIEDPIEYVYTDSPSLIHQREVGKDAASFSGALRSALREDPDVILVGEMRDYETISAAVTAAETGHLVLSTLHTTGAARTMDRIIDIFPPHGQNQIRTQLAGVLRGVITQLLVPLADGSGRMAATEILVNTDAVANLIREGKCHQLNSVIQSGGALGMHTLDSCLADLVRQGLIDRAVAEAQCSGVKELRQLLG
ncbi:MAG: type IV pilus twitching motility protein PilT [Bacillota bacterium]|nr:type IV pilus twitching motility protein PilT [Bacillota bacterium]